MKSDNKTDNKLIAIKNIPITGVNIIHRWFKKKIRNFRVESSNLSQLHFLNLVFESQLSKFSTWDPGLDPWDYPGYDYYIDYDTIMSWNISIIRDLQNRKQNSSHVSAISAKYFYLNPNDEFNFGWPENSVVKVRRERHRFTWFSTI